MKITEVKPWPKASYWGEYLFVTTAPDNSNGALKLAKLPGLGIEMNRVHLEANEIVVA